MPDSIIFTAEFIQGALSASLWFFIAFGVVFGLSLFFAPRKHQPKKRRHSDAEARLSRMLTKYERQVRR